MRNCSTRVQISIARFLRRILFQFFCFYARNLEKYESNKGETLEVSLFMCLSPNKMNAKNVTISPNSCTTNKQRYIQLFSVKQTRHSSSHMPSNIIFYLWTSKPQLFSPSKLVYKLFWLIFKAGVMKYSVD